MSRLLQSISDAAKKAGKPFNCDSLGQELAQRQSLRSRSTDPAVASLEEGLLAPRNSTNDGDGSEHSESERSNYGSDANEQEEMLDAEERGVTAQNPDNVYDVPPPPGEDMDPGRPGRSRPPGRPGSTRRRRAGLTTSERRELERLRRKAIDQASRKATFDCLDIFMAIGKCMSECGSKLHQLLRDCIYATAACLNACGDHCTQENIGVCMSGTFWAIIFIAVFIAIGFGISALVKLHQGVPALGSVPPTMSATLAVANATGLPH